MTLNLIKISFAALAIVALAPALIQGKAVPAAARVQERLQDGGNARHLKYIGSMGSSSKLKGNVVKATSHYFLSTNNVSSTVHTFNFLKGSHFGITSN